MKPVELHARVRHACYVEGLSTREAARHFSLHHITLRKVLAHTVPPGYRQGQPPQPKLNAFMPIMAQILAAARAAAACH